MDEYIAHIAAIAKDNANFHRKKFLFAGGDRYHLGQWKAYYRVYKKLITPEKGRRISDIENLDEGNSG
jgi:hypothetical protein